MDAVSLRALLEGLARGDTDAWPAFLREYSPHLLQVARHVERDADAASDAFLFICERLRERRCRRLKQFDLDGAATFTTWLRAVAWNLAIDARRRRLGRLRPLAAIRRLPVLQQRWFRLRHQEGLTFEEAFGVLRVEFPGLSSATAQRAEVDVEQAVESRQRWRLLVRRPTMVSIDAPSEDVAGVPGPPDSGLDPERLTIEHDELARLGEMMAELPPEDQVLLRLRFEENVTLARLAQMLGLKDQWAADRRLRAVMAQLRARFHAIDRDGSV
jgi:DNA-directed RNA polymerase specialized sigma24 family protein